MFQVARGLFIFVLWMILSWNPWHTAILAQNALCTGNLGDNIFVSGDFGSGTQNIFPTDPGFAPGFMYTTQMPPDDGEYTLTNDMRLWPDIFNSWLRTGDNDIDPDGYMMVVNASFSPGIFYEQTINNLCENTHYQFSADMINIIQAGVTGHILPNVSFLLDDVVVYSTGQIPQDETWHNYGFTFNTGPGQFSLKLSLRNNAPGGIGNDLALDNIEFQACGPESSISIEPAGRICENSLFPVLTAEIEADTGFVQWEFSEDDGFTWNAIPGATDRTHQVQQLSAGFYYFRYLYATSFSSLSNPKCRIVSNWLPLEIVPVEFILRDTVCEGTAYALGDSLFWETGVYIQELTASNGCDSIVTLELEVVPDPMIMASFGVQPTSCEGADDGSIAVLSIDGARPPFFFIVDDSLVPPPSTLIELPAGIYTARIEDLNGCYDSATVVIPEGPPFELQAGADTTVHIGYPAFLSANGNLPVSQYSWMPADSIQCATCQYTSVIPSRDQTYVVEGVTEGGCVDKDSIRVRVDRTPILFTPNIFSPNLDGINDIWTIHVDPVVIPVIHRVQIFDRWGGVLAEVMHLFSDETIPAWDGFVDGQPVNPGVYVYLIEFELADGTRLTTSGDITVIR